MPRYSGGGGSSSYLPNSPPSQSRPTSAPSVALSTYSRPSAAVMYADMSTANALNQQLIQQALERARKQAEELRRLAEERARQQMEANQRAQEAARREAANAPGSVSATSATTPDWAVNPPTVGTGDFQGVSLDYRNRADARRMGAEGWNPYDASYVIGPYGAVPESPDRFGTQTAADRVSGGFIDPYTAGLEGWRNGGRFGTTRSSAQTAARLASFGATNVTALREQGGPDFKTLAERYSENFDLMYFQAQKDVWGEPEPIIEKVPTGRYETVKDANGKVISSTPIYEERIVGYDWSYSTDAQYVDPQTGELVDRRGYGRPVEYLGMPRGLIIANLPPAPAEDADMSEWKAYYNGMKSAITRPLYDTESPVTTLMKMDTDARTKLQKQMIAAQILPADAVLVKGKLSTPMIEAFGDVMAFANVSGQTWELAMNDLIRAADERNAAASGYGGGGGGGGGGDTVYKQIQYNQTSVAQARSLLIGVLTEALGRYPTDDEVQRFLSMLNKQEKKSPSKTVTRTSTDGSTTTAVSRMTPSTVDAQALAEEFARGLEGYDENAMDRYMNALFESMGEARV